MLTLWTSVLAIVLTGESIALEGIHTEDDSCDIFQEFRVWTILERMFRHESYGRHCMLQAIQELGHTFKNHSRTPPYCSCSGKYELGTYSITG
ncbi:hypothetical protein CHS0354_031959, partial [Potamilus streckersoni]